MTKKKNIAMMMAAVTVATSVAPVFASNIAEGEAVVVTINSKNSAKLVGEVRKALEVKYSEVKAGKDTQTVGGRVYTVTVDGSEITNATQLENKISALVEGTSLVVEIKDKGHKVVDGKVVDYTVDQFKSVNEIVEAAKAASLIATIKSTDTVEVKRAEDAKDVVNVKVGEDKVDFAKVIEDDKSKLVGFEKAYTDIEDKEANVITVKNSNAELTKIDTLNLYDGIRLTNEGREFFNKVEKAVATTGQTVTVENEKIFDAGFSEEDGKAKFDIVIKKDGKELEVITISNEDQHLVRAFVQMVKDVIAGKDVKVVNVVAGDSRFTTAVEVSKQRFAAEGSANAVVLVGEDAIVDGLAAAPLATQENAPILLTKQNDLTKETEAEILRALGSTNLSSKTIYVVGGEARISKDLETNLAKLGVKVERLAGDSRQETSIAIAKKLNNFANAFVVGADGEADAMSISARAAQFKSPIIVADKTELNKQTKTLLDGKDIEIIGGKAAVSEAVETELKEIDKDQTITRLAGETRKDTNAAVINKYYSAATSAYVAKDGYVGGNGKLIDALTAAPLAAEAKAPIVLTTDELSKSQEEAIELRLSNVNEVTQIGNGITKTVVEKIVELLKGF